MRSGLLGQMLSQGGVFLRRQAIASGYTTGEFSTMTRPRGPWVRVRYGAYTTRNVWEGLDLADQMRLRDRAALLVCNQHAVASHSSSARLRDLPLFDVDDGLSHVTRLGSGNGSRVQAGIKHHLAHLAADDCEYVDGVRLTSAVRTVLDVTREFGYRSGLVTADGALRAGASHAELRAAARALSTTPRGPVIKAVAEAADGRAQTPIETLARILLVNMGLTDLDLQVRFDFPSGGWAEVDIYSRSLRHVFETDGRLKYQPQLDRFGQPISAEQVVWMEKKREDKLRGQALGVSRIYWSDTLEESFSTASARLWNEIRVQGARWHKLPPTA